MAEPYGESTIKAFDVHKGERGRPHALNDPAFARQVAELFVAGLTRQEIADEVGVKDLATISRWRRDPRVKNIALKITEDRVLQITRKIDSQMESILQNAGDLTVKELLEIRKEYLGGALRTQTERADDADVAAAVEAIEENPELADALEKLLGGRQEDAVTE